jgi:hypothetical protein
LDLPERKFILNSLFIDRNDTIYVTTINNQSIYKWHNDSTNSTTVLTNHLHGPQTLFISTKGDMYINNGLNGRIDKWIAATDTAETIVYFSDYCFKLFIDRNDTLYCLMPRRHQVATKSLHDSSNITTVVAGTGVEGSAANMLHLPQGIFVDSNFDLYVADTGNNRILLFRPGELNGVTVAGSHDTIILSDPSGVVLDANNHIYIVEREYNRIIASGPYGFRCVVGCTEMSGSSSSRLFFPTHMAFDTYGNIFVCDTGHYRVQKFLLLSNIRCTTSHPDFDIYNSYITKYI